MTAKVFASVITFGAMLLSGCAEGDGGTTTAANATSPVPAGTLRVRVTAGAKAAAAKAPLVVAPYTSCPPAGPPVGLVFARVESPVYPQVADLAGLPPGRYHVLAYVGAGMQPAPDDPQTCGAETATLTDEAGGSLEVVLP